MRFTLAIDNDVVSNETINKLVNVNNLNVQVADGKKSLVGIPAHFYITHNPDLAANLIKLGAMGIIYIGNSEDLIDKHLDDVERSGIIVLDSEKGLSEMISTLVEELYEIIYGNDR